MSNLFVLLLALTACDKPRHFPDGRVIADPGRWEEIPPYPSAPSGTRCWIYGGGLSQSSWGGPWCVEPEGSDGTQ